MTKRDRQYYELYKASFFTKLQDVYGQASWKKIDAYNKWYETFYRDPTATGFKIITHNTFVFSLGWTRLANKKKIFVYVTKSGMREVEVV